VERAVEREMRRQKYFSLLFTVLLLIPLGLAGYYFVSGRTDRQVVREEIAQRVEPVEKIAREAQPALAEVKSAAAAVREQQRRVESLVQGQEEVRTQVTQLSEAVPRLEATLAHAQEVSTRLIELRSTLEAQDARLAAVAKEQERIGGELKDLAARTERVPQADRFDELRRQLESLDGRVTRLDRSLRDRVTRPVQ
jgi:chromosome segregation ATPase